MSDGTFLVECPCCKVRIEVDRRTGKVLKHWEKPKVKEGGDLMNEFYKKYNIHAIPAGNTGAQMALSAVVLRLHGGLQRPATFGGGDGRIIQCRPPRNARPAAGAPPPPSDRRRRESSRWIRRQ